MFFSLVPFLHLRGLGSCSAAHSRQLRSRACACACCERACHPSARRPGRLGPALERQYCRRCPTRASCLYAAPPPTSAAVGVSEPVLHELLADVASRPKAPAVGVLRPPASCRGGVGSSTATRSTERCQTLATDHRLVEHRRAASGQNQHRGPTICTHSRPDAESPTA